MDVALAPTPDVVPDTVESAFAGEPVFAPPPVQAAPVSAQPVARRRLDMVQQRREAVVRTVPGQLPTFERGYLVSELRQIGITSGALFAFIVVLAILLR
jgi:hypothetical protein